MTPLTIIFGIGLFAVLLALFLVVMKTQTSAESAVLEEVSREAARRGRPTGDEGPSSAVKWFAAPFALARSIISKEPSPKVARELALAGYREAAHVDIFVGARLLVPAGLGLLVVLLVSEGAILFFLAAVVLGFFAPDFWLTAAIKARRSRIQENLPDGLDLMSICLEAGLGLDQAIARVAQELKLVSPDLSQELQQINYEQRAGVGRLDSWKAFAERVKLDELRQFVAMLIQTERFGTPIAVALNSFSQSLRLERRQKAEEMGAKAAIKMIFPLAIFIFPTIFIVLVGPAIIKIIRNLDQLLQ